MKITETTQRECCEDRDIVRGLRFRGRCNVCGQKFVQRGYTDAAGDRDWRWVKVDEAKEAAE